ncbi:MAG: type III pantothenate kinase [Elusimicrobiota bacterium]
MLLALDAGNTSVSVCVFRGQKIVRRWRRPSGGDWSAQRLGDELNRMAGRLRISGAIYGSVVPRLDAIITKAVRRAFGLTPKAVNARSDLGIAVKIPGGSEVGADLLLNAVAAHHRANRACVIVDMGTATTIQCVSDDGGFLGGAILPGPETAAWALAQKTALLPLIRTKKPSRVIGRDTVQCLQSGIYYGCLGAVEKIVRLSLMEMPVKKNLPVFVTGGLSALFRRDFPKGFIWEPDLTLHGLRIAWTRMGGVGT